MSRSLKALNGTQKAGLAILFAISIIAAASPYLPIADPYQTGAPFQRPSSIHPLGTNDLGQDNLSRLLLSSGNTLMVALFASLVSLSIGFAVGVVSGYKRGASEESLMGITDVFLLMPAIPLMILISSYLSPSIWNIVLVIGLLWWCPTARVVHARTLQIRDMNYVKIAKTQGYGVLHIVLNYILPNTKDVLVARFTLSVVVAMLAEASLAFLGLGDPLSMTWGMMINSAFQRGGFFNAMWWWYLPPGLMIMLTASAFLLLGRTSRRKVISEW